MDPGHPPRPPHLLKNIDFNPRMLPPPQRQQQFQQPPPGFPPPQNVSSGFGTHHQGPHGRSNQMSAPPRLDFSQPPPGLNADFTSSYLPSGDMLCQPPPNMSSPLRPPPLPGSTPPHGTGTNPGSTPPSGFGSDTGLTMSRPLRPPFLGYTPAHSFISNPGLDTRNPLRPSISESTPRRGLDPDPGVQMRIPLRHPIPGGVHPRGSHPDAEIDMRNPLRPSIPESTPPHGPSPDSGFEMRIPLRPPVPGGLHLRGSHPDAEIDIRNPLRPSIPESTPPRGLSPDSGFEMRIPLRPPVPAGLHPHDSRPDAGFDMNNLLCPPIPGGLPHGGPSPRPPIPGGLPHRGPGLRPPIPGGLPHRGPSPESGFDTSSPLRPPIRGTIPSRDSSQDTGFMGMGDTFKRPAAPCADPGRPLPRGFRAPSLPMLPRGTQPAAIRISTPGLTGQQDTGHDGMEGAPGGDHPKEEDQIWLESWLKQRKVARVTEPPKKAVTFTKVKGLVREVFILMEQLEDIMDHLSKNEVSGAELKDSKQTAHKIQARLHKIKSQFDEGLLEQLVLKMNKTRKKRARLKRLKKEQFIEDQERQERRAKLHEELDQWQTGLRQKEHDIKRAKELKAVADETLAEVRRKVQDIKRSLDTLKALEKLRQLRAEAARRKGVHVTKESDQMFINGIQSIRTFIRSQLDIYEDEQKTLQVMLDHEKEELDEVELEKKQQVEEEMFHRREKQIHRMMFGSVDISEEMEEKLASYGEYYMSADQSFEAFLQIRHDWDLHLAPEGTPSATRIPAGWVVPVDPCSIVWATALKDNQNT